MKSDLNYSASDCFETFPFPPSDALTPTGSVAQAGEALYEERAKLMVERDQGLTTTYNQLKDPEHSDPDIEKLRELHVDMDRVVLAGYSWDDLEPPPYPDSVTEEERAAKQAFEDEIIDRLFALNAERAERERRLGMTSSGHAKPRKSFNEPKHAANQRELVLAPGSTGAKP